MDGGILANNPSECGLTKIQSYYRSRGEKLPISLVVSVGSGKNPVKKLGSTDSNESFARVKSLIKLFTNAVCQYLIADMLEIISMFLKVITSSLHADWRV